MSQPQRSHTRLDDTTTSRVPYEARRHDDFQSTFPQCETLAVYSLESRRSVPGNWPTHRFTSGPPCCMPPRFCRPYCHGADHNGHVNLRSGWTGPPCHPQESGVSSTLADLPTHTKKPCPRYITQQRNNKVIFKVPEWVQKIAKSIF